MNKKLIKDISASTTQVILNQLLGMLIFIITSRYLAKSVYGELNWSLAILTFVTTLLSLRLEQIVVRKVASGDDPSKMLTIFSAHIFFCGIVFYCLLIAGSFVFPSFFQRHNLLLILAISQLLSFFSLPYKQLVTGKELFSWLAAMSSVSNIVRSVLLAGIVIFSTLSIRQVLAIYIISSFAELLAGIYLVQKRMGIKISIRYTIQDYYALIKESLPQIWVVFLNACIARIDWILLGIFSTQVVTAEYSFAYKLFELSPLPLLIIAPILLTRFSRYFGSHTQNNLTEKKHELSFLIRVEMILATFLPLVLNIVWVPLIDGLTQNKYGAVNKTTFLLLSFCIPFQYLINLFWTIHFSLNNLALILRITSVTCIIIVAGDLLMIPLMNARGAALVYLAAMIVEFLFYVKYSFFADSQKSLLTLTLCVSVALLSGFSVDKMEVSLLVKLFLSVTIYFMLLILTRQVKKGDLVLVRQHIINRDANLKFSDK